MNKKLKIGVLGTGHLGKIHLRCILASAELELVGFFDADTKRAEMIANELKIKAFDTAEALIDACEAIDIVTPTVTHFELAKAAILRGRSVFIEKPLTHTVAEAEELVLRLIESEGAVVWLEVDSNTRLGADNADEAAILHDGTTTVPGI